MNSKLSLIIAREYTTRVFRLRFFVMSLLIPIGMLIMMALPSLIAMAGAEGATLIAVLDKSSACYSSSLEDNDAAVFTKMPVEMPESDLRKTFKEAGFDAYLVITGAPVSKDSARMYSFSKVPLEAVSHTEHCLCGAIRRQILLSATGHVPEVDSLFTSMNEARAVVATIDIDEAGNESEKSAEIGAIVSLVSGMLIYMFVIITGSMVMQAVAEEKQNRIVEVIVSSVRPFELMMGKILGIGLVALTQIVIWGMFSVGASLIAGTVFGISGAVAPPDSVAGLNVASATAMQQVDPSMAENIMRQLMYFNFIEIGLLFVVYFIGGYLVYGSLFAIAGAISDPNSGEGNQFTIIVMIPIFAATYIAIHAMQDPDSSLSFWSSMVPFTSPIIMMTRVPAGSVPAWEIILSLFILAATIFGLVWVAGRIYRVGILMYGKKVTMSEVWRWFKSSSQY